MTSPNLRATTVGRELPPHSADVALHSHQLTTESDFSRRQWEQPIVGEFVRIMAFPESSLPLIVICTLEPEVTL
jgi:hypothetical protein